MKSLLLAIIVLLLPHLVWATDRNVTTAAELTTALAAATAGDNIILADGTYNGSFATTNAGSSGNPITIKALNVHGATLTNSNSCAGGVGLQINGNYWTVQDLVFDQQDDVIVVNNNVTNLIVMNNIITNWRQDAIRTRGGVDSILIENNVIGLGGDCVYGGLDPAGIQWTYSGGTDGTDNSTIRNNIVYGTGDNGYQAGSKEGYGIYINDNSDDNTIQGNLLFANGGKGVFRLLAGTGFTVDRNVVRDNAFLWGEGGGMDTSDCADDSNDFINNILVGVYHSMGSSKGNDDDTRGHHEFSHNFIYMSPFSRIGVSLEGGGCAATINYKIQNTFKDNLLYSEDTMGTIHTLFRLPSGAQGSGTYPIFATNGADYNLFYGAGSDTGWVTNYTYQSHDIHSSQPTFNDATNGDFSLASGSAGEGAASDATDIGIAYNQYLKKRWLKNAFQLPTQENDSLQGSTSTSFTVKTDHYYQIYFYIPDSSYYTGSETFTVEGDGRARDLSTLDDAIWVEPSGPARWITLGRQIATDGTLNISWTNSNSADKIFIRELPTPEEAYGWIAFTPSNLAAPIIIQ